MYAIEARGLTKTFRSRGQAARTTRAVDGVDVLVREGESVALLGPNGAGKTTTLMMLLGVTQPDAGTVRLLGHPLPQERTQALTQTNFSASYVGFPNRVRVGALLRIFAGLYGVPKQRTDEVIELFGLAPFLRRFSSQLSSGQRTLVGLAKALLSRPRLLVLDEPTASLDPEVAARVREVLQDRQRTERFTFLITSHNMSDIERLCERVVFIAGGRIAADGTPQEVAARYGAADLETTFLTLALEHRGQHRKDLV